MICGISEAHVKLEGQVNQFLARLPEGAVKHVTTETIRYGVGDQGRNNYVVSIWYEGVAEDEGNFDAT